MEKGLKDTIVDFMEMGLTSEGGFVYSDENSVLVFVGQCKFGFDEKTSMDEIKKMIIDAAISYKRAENEEIERIIFTLKKIYNTAPTTDYTDALSDAIIRVENSLKVRE